MYKQGYLWKECTRFKRKKRKWVILEDEKLYCYKLNKQDLTHTFDVKNICNIQLSQKKPMQFELTYLQNKKKHIEMKIILIAASLNDMNDWIKQIRNAMFICCDENDDHDPIDIISNSPSKSKENRNSMSSFRYKKRNSMSSIAKELEYLKQIKVYLQKKIIHFQNMCDNQAVSITKLRNELITKDGKIEMLYEQIGRLKCRLKRSNNNKTRSDDLEYTQILTQFIKQREEKEEKRKYSYLSVSDVDNNSDDGIQSFWSKLSIDTSPISLQLSTTSIAVSPMSAVSGDDNTFENDYNSHGAVSGDDFVKIGEDDIFCKLDNIKESKLNKKLIHESIIFESLMKVYSSFKENFVDIAGILTKNDMYFISALNYKIWQEFRDRTEIDILITSDNTQIVEKIAIKLAKNLDLMDDITNSKIVSYFVGKTKKEIKLEILLNTNKITSISSLFHDDNKNNESFKDIKHVIIHEFFNENVIEKRFHDEFLEYIFDEIPWIDQYQQNDSIIITLQKYHYHGIIEEINDRKLKYFANNKYKLSPQRIQIGAYDDNIKYIHSTPKVVDLNNYVFVELLDSDKYGISIKYQDEIGEDMTCLFESNNIRFEWIAHLDYFMNYNLRFIEEKQERETKYESIATKDKLMNDFTDNDAHFGFGVYLNYWLNGCNNSVSPKYNNLKEELLKNCIARITERDYIHLYEKCLELIKIKRYKIRAQDIGVNNKKFNIKKGESITINHLIALKVYTDYNGIQREFKKHCRKYNEYETMHDFIVRNSEIAIWCRYLKESCTFFGTLMGKNTVLYTGLKRKLLFSSMRQQFEFPCSTTKCWNIARGFCNDNGIILKLKAANSKTRFFDVSWLSHFEHEKERLICGASLKIDDIYINGETSKRYISALHLFEQIIDGKFIDTKDKMEEALYELMVNLLYKRKTVPKYIMDLFKNMVQRMQKQYELNTLYINKEELNKIKHKELHCLLNGCCEFFNYFDIYLSEKNWIQSFEWKIEGNDYKEFVNLKSRKYIKSNECKYKINEYEEIGFHLECCSKYSDEINKVALFLHLDYLPSNIEGIRIEYDLLCDKKRKYQNKMIAQFLSTEKRYCGFQTFSSSQLNKNCAIQWNIGIKVSNIRYKVPIFD